MNPTKKTYNDLDLLCPTSLCEIQQLLLQEQMLCDDNLEQLHQKNRKALTQKQQSFPCYDSRQLKPQDIFVALIGEHFDGHQFIVQALTVDISGIVYQTELSPALLSQITQQGIAAFRVRSSRPALALLSAHCFGYPSQKIPVLGITGTNGKTSIAYLTYQILNNNEKETNSVGLLSTFGSDLGTGLQPNSEHQTTPESLVVQKSLARMLANGCRFAVVECSSHGLAEQTARLMYVQFYAALFSNLSPEHLEFHGSMLRYAQDKARLFSQLCRGGVAIWNIEEAAAITLYNASGKRKDIQHWGYTAGSMNNNRKDKESYTELPLSKLMQATNIQLDVTGSQFELLANNHRYPCSISIPGLVYVSNVLGAISLCDAVLKNKSLLQLLQNICIPSHKTEPYDLNIKAPMGRMEFVPGNAPFVVLIDYAHSPGAFVCLLPEIKTLLDPSARLLILFGSAGLRDSQKRPLQGELAAQYADIIVLCNEDPREEDEMEILKDIQAGIKEGFWEGQNLFLIPDRYQAIAHIFSLAKSGDLVLLLGKGHETSIILSGHKTIPWNEREVARELLSRY